MIKRFVCHCKNWNSWRKSNRNNCLHKIHTFFDPKVSPTFMQTKKFFIHNDKIISNRDLFYLGFMQGLEEANNDSK